MTSPEVGRSRVLEPVLARYRERGIELYLRADAAFAKPELYERLEGEDVRYAIRLPANRVLQERIGHLPTRPVGRPPRKPQVFHAGFSYQAQSWTKPRRVMATVDSPVSPPSRPPERQSPDVALGTPVIYRDRLLACIRVRPMSRPRRDEGEMLA